MHEQSGWSIFIKCSFDATKNKLDYYRRKDCITVLCKKLKDHSLKIINYEKKEMIPLSEEENKSYEKQDVCYIRKENFYLDENDNEGNDNDRNKKYRKVKHHCHYTAKFRGPAHNYCNL